MKRLCRLACRGAISISRNWSGRTKKREFALSANGAKKIPAEEISGKENHQRAAGLLMVFDLGRSEKIARYFPAVRATMEPQRDCCNWCNRLLQRPRRHCEVWPGPIFIYN